MKPTTEQCRKQLERLVLLRLPGAPDGFDEHVAALISCCRDEAHVDAVVTVSARGGKYFPDPVDLIETAREFPEEAPRHIDCRPCGSTGLRSQRFLRTWREGRRGYSMDRLPEPETYAELAAQKARLRDDQDIIEATGPCEHCALGRWKAEKHREYEAERADKVQKAVDRKVAKRANDELRRGSVADYKMAAGGE